MAAVESDETAGAHTFVLVPGLPGDKSQMAPLAKLLASRAQTLTLELPDSGPSSSGVSLDPDDAVRYVRDVVVDLSPAPVSLFGFSVGAWACARLASIDPPTNLQRLMLLGGFHRLTSQHVESYATLATE